MSSAQEEAFKRSYNFSFSKCPDIPNLIAPVERSFKLVNFLLLKRDFIRLIIKNTIEHNAAHFPPKITRDLSNALLSIKSNYDIFIYKAHKEFEIVLQDKAVYLN